MVERLFSLYFCLLPQQKKNKELERGGMHVSVQCVPKEPKGYIKERKKELIMLLKAKTSPWSMSLSLTHKKTDNISARQQAAPASNNSFRKKRVFVHMRLKKGFCSRALILILVICKFHFHVACFKYILALQKVPRR